MATSKVEKKSRARKTSTKQTRVYNYGVPFLSDKDRETINDQLLKAHRYRNKLIEIERSRRSAFRQLRSSICPDLEGLEEQLDNLNKEYDQAKLQLCKLERKERDGSAELQRCETLREQLKELSGCVKKMRAEVSKRFFKSADEEFKARKDGSLSSIARDVMTYREEDIVFDDGTHFAIRTPKGFSVYARGTTAATRIGRIGQYPIARALESIHRIVRQHSAA